MLCMVCNGVEIEPVLQDVAGVELNRGANTAPDARTDSGQGILGEEEASFLRCENLTSKCKLLQRYGSRPDNSSNMKDRRSASTLAELWK